MPGHHRNTAEATERWVANELAGDSTLADTREEAHADMVPLVVDRIRADFPDFTRATQIGNSYDSIGDLRIIPGEGDDVYIELKVVKSGTGTLSNLGQDRLTDFELFNGAKSWSEFRADHDHHEWVRAELDRFEDYPDDLGGSPGTKTRRYAKAKHLKRVIDSGRRPTETVAEEILASSDATPDEKQAAQIILDIVAKDREEKQAYLAYLAQQEQNEANVRRLALLLLCGVHTGDLLTKYWDVPLPELEQALDRYRIYYAIRQDKEVRMKEPLSLIGDLSTKQFTIVFDADQTSVKLVMNDTETAQQRTLLRIAFHWGNKFQGIQTPRLNVFEGDMVAELS